MKIIKQTYGGFASKSILASRFIPSATMLEKCKELDIYVFFMFAIRNQPGNSFQKLIAKLNDIDRKVSLSRPSEAILTCQNW